ncbi:hypothetical protein BX600DRAFT_517826 [Xylariales sp. PMI_506]|nr:hypothetical protein BX600DRAFT_517826 [Xylariales sp. PMI_506]
MPISQSKTLFNFTGASGGFLSLLGLYGLTQPRALLEGIGFEAAATPQSQQMLEGVTRIYAVRNVVIGSIVMLVHSRGDRKLLGGVYMLIGLNAIVDAVVCGGAAAAGGSAMHHLPFAPLVIGVGSALMGWLD